jgi:hypothetical protein
MVKKKTIDDIISDECSGRYCILQEVIRHSGMQDFMLEQMKCIEKFKFEESERKGFDVGWNEATFEWANRGYAKKYREVYEDGMSFRELYRRTMK